MLTNLNCIYQIRFYDKFRFEYSNLCAHFSAPLNSTQLSHVIDTDTRNQGNTTTKAQMGPILRKTKTILEKFYAPYSRALAAILGDPKFSYSL